jgi:hypothetical protein
MKNVFVALLLFSSLNISFAQQVFKDGYFINQDGKTIKGELLYQSNSKNYNSAIFRQSGNIIEYSPDEISAFGYTNGKHFVSGILEKQFVEALVIGTMSLYRYNELYYLKKDDLLQILDGKDIEMEINGQIRYKENTRWKGILAALTNDCSPNLNERINGISFNEQSLTRVIVNYNKCRNVDYHEYKENQKFLKISAGATLGLVFSKFKINDINPQTILPDSYSSSDPFFGGHIILSSPRVSDKFSLFSEVAYYKAEYDGTVVYDVQLKKTTYDTYMSISTLSIPLAIRYSTVESTLSFFVMSGINYDKYLEWEAKLNTTRVEYGVTTEESELNLLITDESRLGFWGSAGISRTIGAWNASLGVRYYIMNAPLDKLQQVNSNRVIVTLMITR